MVAAEFKIFVDETTVFNSYILLDRNILEIKVMYYHYYKCIL
jgi:hypothetical protein